MPMTPRRTTLRAAHNVKPRWLHGLLALAVVGAPLQSAHALDLRQAYEAAIAADTRLEAARATFAASAERLPQARAQLRPNIGFTASVNRNELDSSKLDALGNPVDTQSRYTSNNQGVVLRQVIFRRQQFLNVDQAEYLVEDARYTLESELQSTAVRLSTAYFDALLATDQLALIDALKVSTRAQLDAADKALLAGSGTRTDVDLARARLDMVRAQEIEARLAVDATRRQLQSIIGRPPGELAALDPARAQVAAGVSASLSDLIAQATGMSPEIRSLRARVEASRLEVDKAAAGHYPTLDLVAQTSRTLNDTVPIINNTRYYNRSIGLQVGVPIYAGGYVSSVERQAQAQYQNLQAQLEGGLLDLSLKVEKEYRGVTEGLAKIQAQVQATRSAAVSLDSTRKSYAAGVRTVLNVLDAEQELKMNERNLIQARYAYITARIRLGALTGDALPVIDEVSAWLK